MVVFLSFPLTGQFSTDYDTIKIKAVVIGVNKPVSDQSGFKNIKIDSTVMINYSNRDLADLLSENSGIFIKSYGLGGISTLSFRGTGASHTLIDWNGISINSPMLGQSDLSLIPVGLIDNIHIYYGGASMALNEGGIGGTINLETGPSWKKETAISVNSGFGSFGSYSGFAGVKAGNLNFQTITKAFFQNSENDFRYLNYRADPVKWQTRTNSQIKQRGFVQELYYTNSKNILSARIWYQSSDRNLSTPIGIPEEGEKQRDESLRTMLSLDIPDGKSKLSFTAAWVMDRLNYSAPLAAIDSRNLSEMLTLKAGYENMIGDYSKLKITVDGKSNVINSSNYDNITKRNTVSLTASINRERGRFGSTILVRGILDRQKLLVPDFSAGLQYSLSDSKKDLFKANISRNSKLPAMNDMFFGSGGNPDLKNEYSMIYEFSYEMSRNISNLVLFGYDLTLFHYAITDMIQWNPGKYSEWSAENINKVNSSGAESSISVHYKTDHLDAKLKASYILTLAKYGMSKLENDNSAGKQLIYTPEHQTNTSMRIGYKKFYSTWVAYFVGKRYTTKDDSYFVSGYFINNVMAGVMIPVKSSSLDINFGIDNVFNTRYQSIANYPLPGRSFNVKILIQLVK
jgi:iron complex outermembrane receptor protein